MTRSLAELREEVARLEAELAAREAAEASPADTPAEPAPVAQPAATPVAQAAPQQPAPAVPAPEPAAKPAAGGPPVLTMFELQQRLHQQEADAYSREMRFLAQQGSDPQGKEWFRELMARCGRATRQIFPR
jgi:hypothetical protein